MNETFEQMDAREKRFLDAKKVANDSSTPLGARQRAIDAMWDNCFAPAKRRSGVKCRKVITRPAMPAPAEGRDDY